MTAIEIARRFAELGDTAQAQRAYALALGQEQDRPAPAEELEAASYLLFSGGDYRVAYSTFIDLHRRDCFRDQVMDIVTPAFYLPNLPELEKQYRRNCKALSRYPYLFRRDFLPFEALPLRFYPFDGGGYIPYDPAEDAFGEYYQPGAPVINRYFFRDLEKPLLAERVFSQYQLEYLNDTVRDSTRVGRDNHIYLHYPDWGEFCAYLAVLDLPRVLKEKKLVFLIGEELARYPIDFRAEFGIDYGQYAPRPVGIREVNRLIWHVQLSSHNGGDFFNEVLYGHPNLLYIDSLMFSDVEEVVGKYMAALGRPAGPNDSSTLRHLRRLKNPTEKDALVAIFLYDPKLGSTPDPAARVAPALLFQPHFYNIFYAATVCNEKRGYTTMESEEYQALRDAPFVRGFRYVKTFTPMRRITNSFAATTRFMLQGMEERGGDSVMKDVIVGRLLNRSYMADPADRLYRDSILVRYEDAKLNPKATFTALAEFLDIPYDRSMEHCTAWEDNKPVDSPEGFSTAGVYRTYDEYAGRPERELLEFFFRDAYEYYGYDFQYYGGEPVDEAWIQDRLERCEITDGLIAKSWDDAGRVKAERGENVEDWPSGEAVVENYRRNRLELMQYLLKGLRFVSPEGQPLRMLEPLRLDPALLEQPIYH